MKMLVSLDSLKQGLLVVESWIYTNRFQASPEVIEETRALYSLTEKLIQMSHQGEKDIFSHGRDFIRTLQETESVRERLVKLLAQIKIQMMA